MHNMMAHSLPHSTAQVGVNILFPVNKLSFDKLKVDALELYPQCFRRLSCGTFAGGGTFTEFNQKCPIIRDRGDYETYA